MDIEIVEFYEIERDDNKQTLVGTLHVYLINQGIVLRGIYVTKRKDYWHFSLPFRNAVNDEGLNVRYPVFSFMDLEKQKALVAAIREKGKAYIEEKQALKAR